MNLRTPSSASELAAWAPLTARSYLESFQVGAGVAPLKLNGRRAEEFALCHLPRGRLAGCGDALLWLRAGYLLPNSMSRARPSVATASAAGMSRKGLLYPPNWRGTATFGVAGLLPSPVGLGNAHPDARDPACSIFLIHGSDACEPSRDALER
eukprot:CAMPEP_0195061678 /NCGR_PEP_ID=MMETSP0448-20130528/8498_1 /TAXON_ID=66468 /ORGANISM="Heterocapsa triquestra, Strain CCMP 448" /LENGTH=152 /DNA_ID=CAMNT_0040092265 /DNA_START=13 /DNA_END=468 /DNA_ORIENTATION=-